MSTPARPWYQTLALALTTLAAGSLLLGAVLDAIGNAYAFVTPLVTYVGTAVLAAAVMTLQFTLAQRPLKWLVHQQIVRITSLRLGAIVLLAGMIVLLWVPRIFKERASTIAVPTLRLRVANVKAPSVLIGNPSDTPVTNARAWFTLWNVDVDPVLPPLRQKLSAPAGERLIVKIKFSEEIPWIPRNSYLPLTAIDFVQLGIKPGDRVLGWVTISCATCLGNETTFIDLKAGVRGQYGHLDSRQLPREDDVEKVLKCLQCPLSSFLSGPSNVAPVRWTAFDQ